MLFGSVTQELLGPLNSDAIFEFLGQVTIKYEYIIFQKGVDDFETEHKTCLFSVRGAVTPLKHHKQVTL